MESMPLNFCVARARFLSSALPQAYTTVPAPSATFTSAGPMATVSVAGEDHVGVDGARVDHGGILVRVRQTGEDGLTMRPGRPRRARPRCGVR